MQSTQLNRFPFILMASLGYSNALILESSDCMLNNIGVNTYLSLTRRLTVFLQNHFQVSLTPLAVFRYYSNIASCHYQSFDFCFKGLYRFRVLHVVKCFCVA